MADTNQDIVEEAKNVTKQLQNWETGSHLTAIDIRRIGRLIESLTKEVERLREDTCDAGLASHKHQDCTVDNCVADKKKIESLTKELEEWKKRLNGNWLFIEIGKIALENEKLKEQLEAVKEEKLDLRNLYIDRGAEIVSLGEELEAVKKERDELKDEMLKIAELSLQDNPNIISSLVDDGVSEKIKKLEADKSKLMTDFITLERKNIKIEAENARAKKTLVQISTQNTELKQKIAELKEEYHLGSEEIDKLVHELADANKEISELKKKVEKIKHKHDWKQDSYGYYCTLCPERREWKG